MVADAVRLRCVGAGGRPSEGGGRPSTGGLGGTAHCIRRGGWSGDGVPVGGETGEDGGVGCPVHGATVDRRCQRMAPAPGFARSWK